MSEDIHQGLTDLEEQKFYESQIDMHATPGWRNFMSEAARIVLEYSDIKNVTPEHSVDFRRGQVDILNWIISQPELIAKCFEERIKQDALAKMELDEVLG